MRPNNTHSCQSVGGGGKSLKEVCVHCCQKVLGQIARTKAAIFSEWREVSGAHEHLLRLALNEAEATAWQTKVPHLVFPTLAVEKVQAVAAWTERQQAVRNGR